MVSSSALAAVLLCTASTSTTSAYSLAALPPLLTFVNGTPVTSPLQWDGRREEVWSLLQAVFYGTFPTGPPPPHTAAVLNTTTVGAGDSYTLTWVNITYATPVYPSSTLVEVLTPAHCTSTSPCPASMASSEHRRWLVAHAARGYVGVSFHAGDNSCDSPQCGRVDPTRCWADNYPSATFALIGRRAYYASRVLDYVLTLPHVRPDAVGLTGHSRNGKETLIAVGSDARFAAAVDSSSGSAGLAPYRCQGGDAQGETPGSPWPGPWFLPSLRGFNGREDELPVDSHSVLGLIAPRPLLLANALNDAVVSTYAVEAAYAEGMTAYAWLGAPDALRVDYRFGDHHGCEAPERYADWFDTAFNHSHPVTCGARCGGAGNAHPAPAPPLASPLARASTSGGTYDASHWPATANLLHAFNWSAWDAAQGYGPGGPPVPPPGASSADRVAWLLGTPPSTLPVPDPGGSYPPSSDLVYVDALQNHDGEAGGLGADVLRVNVGFGPALNGNLYFRKDMLVRAPPTPRGWPAVLFLHSVNYNKGYVPSYQTDSLDIAHALANASAVVLVYEQVGHGLRLQEGAQFYDRWPTWSKLGKMVHDALSALSVLLSPQAGSPGAFFPSGLPDALTGVPTIDPTRVYATGYSLGGLVALVAAGMERRVAGVASVSGFTPFRSDTDASTGGGVRRWWSWHHTSPRLGWYAGAEASIPVEVDDVLALLSPRPVLAYTASGDRMSNATGVGEVVARMRAGGYAALEAQSPPGINALDAQARLALVAWLQRQWRGGGE